AVGLLARGGDRLKLQTHNHPEGAARASLAMVLIAKGFGPGRILANDRRTRRNVRRNPVGCRFFPELRTDESVESRPSLDVLAAVFGVLSRAGPSAGRVWPNR